MKEFPGVFSKNYFRHNNEFNTSKPACYSIWFRVKSGGLAAESDGMVRIYEWRLGEEKQFFRINREIDA